MKIALCFSGQPREFAQTWKYWWFNLIRYDLDVYIHTWNTIDESDSKILNSGAAQEYIDLYKPRKFLVEDYTKELKQRLYQESGLEKYQKEVKERKLRPNKNIRADYPCRFCNILACKDTNGFLCKACGGRHAHNWIAKLYSEKKSVELLEDNYDLVIVSRPDLTLLEKPNFKLTNKVVFPKGLFQPNKWTDPPPERARLPDQIYWTNQPNIKKITGLYERVYDISAASIKTTFFACYTHTCLPIYIRKEGLEIEYGELDYYLYRDLGERQTKKMSRIHKQIIQISEDKGDHLYIELALPGFSKKDIKVSWASDKLVVMKTGAPVATLSHFFESSSFDVSANTYDINKIKTRMENGILQIECYKRENPIETTKEFQVD